MPPAPIPPNEAARLEALRKYDILDTEPEAVFDDLAILASTVTGSPIATFTLVDAERQWFKSMIGLEHRETEREVAFCAHTILEEEALVVPDATRDPRFRDNRLVLDAPGVRFYAGVPVRSREGLNIGSVCVIDRQPRLALLDHQRAALEAIARQASAMLELRRTAAELSGVLRDVRLLSAVLPICFVCRRYRADDGSWVSGDERLARSGTELTHGVCPSCLEQHSSM